MTTRFVLETIREPGPSPSPATWRDVQTAIRGANRNFQRIQALLQRAIADGSLIAEGIISLDMLATAAKTLVGDVTGLISATTVEKIRNMGVDTPAAGDDGKVLAYNHGNADFDWKTVAALVGGVLTTRGDLLTRDAATPVRLALGAAGTVLKSDGTDAAWATVASLLATLLTTQGDLLVVTGAGVTRLAVGAANTVLKSDGTDVGWAGLSAMLDAAFSSTQGAVLYRGAAGWAALGPGTSGHFLQTQGAAADPVWAAAAGGAGTFLGLTDTPAAYTSQAGKYLRVNVGETALEFVSAPGGSSPLTTKGDLYTYAAADARLGVGADDTLLTPDSGEATGLKWATLSAMLDAAIGSTRGSVLYRGDSAWAALTPGTDGQVLKTNGAGADPAWEDESGGGGGIVDAAQKTPPYIYGVAFFANGGYVSRGVCSLGLVNLYDSRGTIDTNGKKRTSNWNYRSSDDSASNTYCGHSYDDCYSFITDYPYIVVDFCTADRSGVDGEDGRTYCVYANPGARVTGTDLGNLCSGTYVGESAEDAEKGVVYLKQKHGTDSYAVFVTGDGSSVTTTTTDVDLFDDEFHDIEIYRDPADDHWKCRIDGSEEADHSTNLPSQGSSAYGGADGFYYYAGMCCHDVTNQSRSAWLLSHFIVYHMAGLKSGL